MFDDTTWRGMISAPKDGTWIITASQHGGEVLVMRWHDGGWEGTDGYTTEPFAGGWVLFPEGELLDRKDEDDAEDDDGSC